MLLRRYRAGDLDDLYAMDVACFAPPYRFTKRLLAQLVRARGAVVLLACEKLPDSEREVLLGFCIVDVPSRGAERLGYLSTLDVAPALRRQGVGRKLLAGAEDALQHLGLQEMALHVAVENTAAIRFYEDCGYTWAGCATGFYGAGLDALVYRKRLDALRRPFEEAAGS